MLIRIINIEPHQDFTISIYFSDGCQKVMDLKPFIGNDLLSSKLKDKDYFFKVKIYKNGRGIYWPNNFDFCPDYLHDYAE